MKVREVIPDDARDLYKLGEDFHNESPFHSRYRINKQKYLQFVSHLATSSSGCMYASFDKKELTGFIGGQMHSMYYTDDQYASECIFYVSPKHRGGKSAIMLIKKFEEWAKDHNAKDIEFGVVTAIDPKKTDKFFKRAGFSYLGANFYKEVE